MVKQHGMYYMQKRMQLVNIARYGNSTNNATLYVTLSPCPNCYKTIVQAGIKRVEYTRTYKDTTGLEFLKQCGIEVVHLNSVKVKTNYLIILYNLYDVKDKYTKAEAEHIFFSADLHYFHEGVVDL